MKLYLLIITIFFFNKTYSQNIDSLVNKFNSTKNEKQVNLAIEISNYYFYSKPDSADKYLNLGLKVASSNNLKKEEATILQNKGILANERGDIDKAKSFFKKTISIAKSISDTSLMISGTGNIGNSFMYAGEYEKAIKAFIEVANIAEKRNDIKTIANSYGAIANLYQLLKKNEKALRYYKKAKLNFEKINNKTGIALSHMNVAVIYYNTKKYEEALNNYMLAYKIFKDNNNYLNSAKCLSGKARILAFKEKFKEAIIEEKKARKIYYNFKANIDIVNSSNSIAFNQIYLGYYKQALVNLDTAYNISIKNNYYSKLERITDNYRIIYDSIGNYKKAYKYLLLNKMYHDSVISRSNNDKLSELEIKYETSQKEKEILLLKKDKEIKNKENRTKQIILFGIITLLISLILIFYLFYNRYKLKSTKRTIEAEQKLLRTQMNPHFIFNALFAIESFIRKNDIDKSATYLSDFSKLMRLILESSRKNYINLSSEINILEYYIKFQQLRFNNKFTYKISYSDNIDVENTLIPPMLVQPFVENAIEHGFTKDIKNPHLNISFNLKENKIFIIVEDNGKGIEDVSNKKNHQSLAIQITKERLLALKDRKNKNINLKLININTINPDLTGTRVVFNIPHIEEF